MDVKVLLKLFEGHLIPIFVLAIVIAFLLDSVVCKVDEFVVQVVSAVLLRAGSNVAVIIEETFLDSID